MQTKYCVYCLKKPARIWTGYVIRQPWRKRYKITAGWCSKFCQRKATGFVGYYKWLMGSKRNELD